MAQISEHINYSYHKIHSYDQMSKIIVNFGSKKGENNENSSRQLIHIHNSLLMIIFDIPTKYLSNVNRKSDMRKVRTYSVKLSSTLFSCSIYEIYNKVNCAKKTYRIEVIHSRD